MKLPPFLLNHGEKLLVALVLLGSIAVVWSTVADEDTQPSRPGSQIEADFARIEQASRMSARPNLRPSVDTAQLIRDRFAVAEQLPRSNVVAFVHEIWSLGQTVFMSYPPYLYGFELRQPSLSVSDQVGSLRLSLTLPEARRDRNHPRLRDGMERMQVTRSVRPQESYTNTAQVLGVQIERRAAGGRWEPLSGIGNDLGFLTLDRVRESLPITDVSEWQSYEFRARLIASATGPEEEGKPTLGNEVLVFAGESPLPPDPQIWEEQDTLAFQGVPLSISTAERMRSVSRSAIASIARRELSSREQVYLGPWSPVVGEQVSSTTRFALVRIAPPLQEGEQPRVTFGLTRQVGGDWLPLQRMDVAMEGPVGSADHVYRDPESGLNVTIDLSTPFKLVDVDLEAERITHYVITNRSDPAQGTRVLEVAERIDRTARTATIENTTTGRQMTLVQLSRIVVRPPAQAMANYPDYEPGAINEVDLFVKDPMGFRQPRLRLPEPKFHEPDDPTIIERFPEAANLRIEVPYISLPDGRFLVIDALNDRIIRIFSDRTPSEDEQEEGDNGDDAD
ncbi:MAG: hypothetical protein EA401_10115 [Planctomycetota bacterium]|nr:MAG: hypothetical protein EA401_10115 [Planctomycetota bacterium]